MIFTPSFSTMLVAAVAVHSATAIPAGPRSSKGPSHLTRRQMRFPSHVNTAAPAPFLNINIDPSCKPSQQYVEGTIQDTAELLAAWPTTDVQKNQAYLKFMDVDGDATRAQTITKRMKKLADITSTTKDISRKVKLLCDIADATPLCKKGAQAHVPSTSDRGDIFETGTYGGTVVLCSRFFPKVSLADAVQKCTIAASNEIGLFRNRGESFLHELTHLNIMMNTVGTEDCVYSSVNCHELARDQPWVAMINADNYAWMALDNYLEQKQTCGKELVAHNFPLKTDDKFNDPDYPRCKLDGSGLRFGQFQTEHNVPSLADIGKRKNTAIPDIDADKDEKSEEAAKEVGDALLNDDEGVDEVDEDVPQEGAHEGEDVIDAPSNPEGVEEFDDGDAADMGNILEKGPQEVPTVTEVTSPMVVTITGFNGLPISTSTVQPMNFMPTAFAIPGF